MASTPAGPVAREDVVFRQLGDEWVLFDPVAYRLHVLNLTAAMVWTHCDGSYDVSGLVKELESAFDAPPSHEQLAAEVEDVLAGFRKEQLLQ